MLSLCSCYLLLRNILYCNKLLYNTRCFPKIHHMRDIKCRPSLFYEKISLESQPALAQTLQGRKSSIRIPSCRHDLKEASFPFFYTHSECSSSHPSSSSSSELLIFGDFPGLAPSSPPHYAIPSTYTLCPRSLSFCFPDIFSLPD